MKVIILRSTFVRGEAIEAGPAPVDLESGDARTLIGMGKAVAYTEPVPTPLAPESGKGAPVVDDLTEIDGIGPARAALLKEKGITTFEQLRDADLDALDLGEPMKQVIETWKGLANA